jgi:hypothetical protein
LCLESVRMARFNNCAAYTALGAVMKLKLFGHLAVFAGAIALSGPAGASELFNLGSPFGVSGTNAPDSYFATVTLNAGSTTIDNGALTVTQSFVNVPGGEWFIFDLQTTSGGPIGSATTNWTVGALSIQTTQLVTALGAYFTWGVSGTLTSPSGCFGATCTIETNPVTGSGEVYRANFSGTGTNPSFSTSVFPFGVLGTSGAFSDAADLNEYQFGIELRAATPLPAALPLFATGIGGLGLLGWRRKRKARAVA